MSPLQITAIANVITFLAVFETLNVIFLYLFPRAEPAAPARARAGNRDEGRRNLR